MTCAWHRQVRLDFASPQPSTRREKAVKTTRKTKPKGTAHFRLSLIAVPRRTYRVGIADNRILPFGTSYVFVYDDNYAGQTSIRMRRRAHKCAYRSLRPCAGHGNAFRDLIGISVRFEQAQVFTVGDKAALHDHGRDGRALGNVIISR